MGGQRVEELGGNVDFARIEICTKCRPAKRRVYTSRLFAHEFTTRDPANALHASSVLGFNHFSLTLSLQIKGLSVLRQPTFGNTGRKFGDLNV